MRIEKRRSIQGAAAADVRRSGCHLTRSDTSGTMVNATPFERSRPQGGRRFACCFEASHWNSRE